MTKPLSRNEMRARAVTFAARWKDESSEKSESQTFWTEFLDIYGVDRKRVAAFEQLAKRTSTGNYGFIDLLVLVPGPHVPFRPQTHHSGAGVTVGWGTLVAALPTMRTIAPRPQHR